MIIINALVDNYSKEELERIVNESFSMTEVISKLGYKTRNGSNNKTVRKRLEKYNISTNHFRNSRHTERTPKNVFCINSTATQTVLRRWYGKISDDSVCEICGQSKYWNGEDLTMILDHIDGDNHNNQIQNLRWICPNCNSQLPTFAGRNTKRRINYVPMAERKSKKKICPVCNINEINLTSKMCVDCRNKEKAKNIPPRKELEKLIYEKSFVAIGEMYGVSDNAVRKWCKKYNLPYRYGELHKYIA